LQPLHSIISFVDDDDVRREIHRRWIATRALSGAPALGWTYHLFMFRELAMGLGHVDKMQGFDLVYEPLGSWSELKEAVEIREILLQHGVSQFYLPHLILGMRVFDSAHSASRGRLPLPSETEAYRGRHSVAVLGLTHQDEIAFANSWGPRWGDEGVGYISRAYFETQVDAVWSYRLNYVGWSPALDAALKHASWTSGRAGRPSPEDVAKAWMTPNRPRGKTILLNGVDVSCSMRTIFSSRAHMPPLEVVELRNSHTLLGRSHIVYPRRSAEAVIEEFFVPPSVRKQKYGSAMHELCLELVRSQSRGLVRFKLHEADMVKGRDLASRAFLERLGYQWQALNLRRPNILATAVRSL